MSKKNIFIWVSIFIIVMIILLMFLLDWRRELIKEYESYEDECLKLEECDIYSCLAELSFRYKEERNLLLQEQNCLLRKGLNSSEVRT